MNKTFMLALIVAFIVALCVYLQLRDNIQDDPSYTYSRTALSFIGTFVFVFFVMYYFNLRVRDNEKLAFDNMKGGEPEF